jgi:uncharacterized membrane protein YsdA (DUF1294 family)
MQYIPLYIFVACYAVASYTWGVPQLVGALYLIASLVCYAAYARDKSAACKSERRTPERTLLLMGLACGWPGALLAQQWLRHKSSKRSFRAKFWVTVVINIGAFLYLANKWGQSPIVWQDFQIFWDSKWGQSPIVG